MGVDVLRSATLLVASAGAFEENAPEAETKAPAIASTNRPRIPMSTIGRGLPLDTGTEPLQERVPGRCTGKAPTAPSGPVGMARNACADVQYQPATVGLQRITVPRSNDVRSSLEATNLREITFVPPPRGQLPVRLQPGGVRIAVRILRHFDVTAARDVIHSPCRIRESGTGDPRIGVYLRHWWSR